MKPVPSQNHSQQKPFVHPELFTATHVFIRHDAHRKPLQPTYDGPYPVMQRSAKYVTIFFNEREDKVSIDRLKPAFILNGETDVQHNHTYSWSCNSCSSATPQDRRHITFGMK
ncbi:hypothetical protein Trydic_g7438 [Trypoxylus dichotomus]